MKAQELYDTVAATLIEKIESGEAGTWSQSWSGGAGLPTNATTRRAYRGGNVLWFWAVADARGYQSSEWATYKQWASIGAQVRKGETATYGIKWVFPTEAEKTAALASGKKVRAFPKAFAVFNADQVDDYAGSDAITVTVDRDAAAETFFAAQGATITTGQPAYNPRTDAISLPPIDAFDTAEAYYATSAHEHTHRTGAASRLNRDGIAEFDHFGSPKYATEELVAEFGAAFTCALLGISPTPRPDHAAYLANWVRAIKDDSKVVFRAASAAQAAVDYMVAQTGDLTPAVGSDPDED